MRTRRVGHSPAIRQARKGMEFDREFSFGDGVSSVSTHVAIRTSILPKFLPCSRPRNAAGAFSSPSTMIVQPDHPLAERDLSSAGGAPLPARFPSASARALGSLSLSSSRSSGTAASIPGCRGPRRPRCHAAGYQIDRFRYLLRQTVQQAPPQLGNGIGFLKCLESYLVTVIPQRFARGRPNISVALQATGISPVAISWNSGVSFVP